MPSPEPAGPPSVTIRVPDIDVAVSMRAAEQSAKLTAERRRLKAGAADGTLVAAETNALVLLEFIEELLVGLRDVRLQSHTQALEALRAGQPTYDAIIHCPPNAGPTFAYLRQLFDRVDELCAAGVLRCPPTDPEARDARHRICAVIEAELASRELLATT